MASVSLPSSRFVPPFAATVEIPLDSFRVLELKIQALSLHVLNTAKGPAQTHAGAGRPKLTKTDVVAALEAVAKEDSPLEGGSTSRPSSQVENLYASLTHDAFQLLNSRMDVLRSYTITLASDLATKGPDQQAVALTSVNMESAWNGVWNNQALRTIALTGGEELFSARAAS